MNIIQNFSKLIKVFDKISAGLVPCGTDSLTDRIGMVIEKF